MGTILSFNTALGKLDSALTDKSLRELYLSQVRKFYLIREITTILELEWIMKRGIALVKCILHEESYIDDQGKLIIDTV